MPIFEVTSNEIRGIPETSFQAVGLRERQDLQRLLREQVAVISPDTMVLAEHSWQGPRTSPWSSSRSAMRLSSRP
jgi:hypothetical protein